MKLSTLFRAYQDANLHRSIAKTRYGTDFGIAVSDKPDAVEWQRYDRLIGKLDNKIFDRIYEYENNN